MIKGLEAALVSYYCITNYYKLRGLKHNTFTISQCMSSGVWAQLNWPLCSGFHKAALPVLAGLHFHLQARLWKNPRPSSFGLLEEFISLWW